MKHFLYGKIQLPSAPIAPHTPHKLFYSRKGSVVLLRPFGCLAYVHLQKDQHWALNPHATQCILIGYPNDYKGWRFWDPRTCCEVVSDSAVFHKSVYPFHLPSLSAVDKCVDLSPPAADPSPSTPITVQPSSTLRCVSNNVDTPPMPLAPEPLLGHAPPCLIPQIPFAGVPDLAKRPRTPPEVRNLLSNFKHHPSTTALLPKCPLHA